MSEETFEAALRARPEDEATRLVYADWLEEQGAVARAEALRGYHAAERFAPVDLDQAEDPENGPPFHYPERDFPLVLLVVGNFWGRPDARPVEDRKPRRLWPERFHAILGEQRVPIERDGTRHTAQSLADLDHAAHHVKKAWWGLSWLRRHVPTETHVYLLNASVEDLMLDLGDARTIQECGLYRTANELNHPGMEPTSAIVVADELHRAKDAEVLRMLGEIGRIRSIPVIAPAAEAFDAEELSEPPGWRSARESPWSRYVALCAPDFVVPREGGEPVQVAASFLVAGMFARSWPQHRGGSGLWGRVGVELARKVTVAESLLAWERGFLSFVSEAGGALLVHDATIGGPGGRARSLSWLLLANRIAIESLRIHYRRTRLVLSQMSAEETAQLLERGLALRLKKAPGLRVALRNARWGSAPTTDFDGELAVDMNLTLDERTHVEPLTLRFSR